MLTATRNAYRFSNFPRVLSEPPVTETTELLDKAFGDEPLTREEKDRIGQVLYGLFGQNGSDYRLMGWCWPMSRAKQLRRILVSTTHSPGEFRTYYAPDKTSLRPHVSGVREMIYA